MDEIWERCIKRRDGSDWEIVSESAAAQRAGGLWAVHGTTFSRSRLLMLSDCGLNPRNRVCTVNTRRGRHAEPFEDGRFHIVSHAGAVLSFGRLCLASTCSKRPLTCGSASPLPALTTLQRTDNISPPVSPRRFHLNGDYHYGSANIHPGRVQHVPAASAKTSEMTALLCTHTLTHGVRYSKDLQLLRDQLNSRCS